MELLQSIQPADGHFIEGNDMEVDESPLTGEPIPIKKSANHDDDHKNPWMIKGILDFLSTER